MNRAINMESHSPWYEAFAPSQNLAQAGLSRAAPKLQIDPAEEPAAVEDAWATEAIFDYYNS